MIDDALKMAKDAMDKAKERLARELASVRTGRANASMLDDLRVMAYGTLMPLNQLATVSVPDGRLVVIKPFDMGNLSAIETAINKSDLGIHPQNDGTVLRLPVPPLTVERRKALIKQVKAYGEDAKILIRTGRREANEFLKEAETDKEISEDDLKKGLERVQTLTDDYVKAVDQTIAKKEGEIMNE